MPCYSLLESLIPESKPMLEGVQKNLDRWKGLADEQTTLKEKAAADAKESEKDKIKVSVTTDSNSSEREKDGSSGTPSTTVNGDAQENGSSLTSSPRSKSRKAAVNNKPLQKQASLTVPVNQINDSKLE